MMTPASRQRSICRRAAATSRLPTGVAHPVPPKPMVPRVIVETRSPDRPSCRYSMTARVGTRASEHAGFGSGRQRTPAGVEAGALLDAAALRRALKDSREPPPAGATTSLPSGGPLLYAARDLVAPWNATLTGSERTLVAYSLIVARARARRDAAA